MDKTCKYCLAVKPLEQFKKYYRKTKNKEKSYTNKCLKCDMKDYKIWRDKNKDYYNKEFRKRRAARKLRAIAYKGGKCNDCNGNFHLSAYDFHHVNPEEKDRDPGLMMSLSDKKLFLELDKCILLCANCHRIRHYIEI